MKYIKILVRGIISMSEKEKNEVTEEAKEETHKLTEEELEQVTGGNIEQEIKNLAKQHFQIEEEGSGEKFKDFLEKYARYYKNILPKK